MLNEELTHVVLAQSYWHKNSWGFPKGKVNEDEAAHRCAGLFFSFFFFSIAFYMPTLAWATFIYRYHKRIPLVLNLKKKKSKFSFVIDSSSSKL